MHKLENNSIIKNPILFYDPIFLDFISLEEKDWIIKQTYYYKQYETPCELEKIYSLHGLIHYNITPDHEKEFSNIKDHLESNERLINTLLSLYKNLFEHMNEMILQINVITEVWKQLKEMSKISKDNKQQKFIKRGLIPLINYLKHLKLKI